MNNPSPAEIEAVAEAMWERSLAGPPLPVSPPWDELHEEWKREWRMEVEEALKAFVAMRNAGGSDG